MSDYNKIRKETTKRMHENERLQIYLWTKTLLLKKIGEVRSDLDFSKLKVNDLRAISLELSDNIHMVEYYKFNPNAIIAITQDDIDALVNKNNKLNQDRKERRKSRGSEIAKEYMQLVEKYNLSPIKTEWDHGRRVEHELRHIKNLEEEYSNNPNKNMSLEEFVYYSLKNSNMRSRHYTWEK